MNIQDYLFLNFGLLPDVKFPHTTSFAIEGEHFHLVAVSDEVTLIREKTPYDTDTRSTAEWIQHFSREDVYEIMLYAV